MPDLYGRVVVVTGANSGIGYEAALAFARRRAEVVLACRDDARAAEAADRIRRAVPNAHLSVERLDLGSLASVRACATRLCERHARLDVLCNNAGVMAIARRLTPDGFETQFAVNHLGHFAFTGLLLQRLRAAERARVVTVSSLQHLRGRMRFDDLDGADGYHPWRAYSQSKLANLLFAYELHRRLRRSGARAVSVACHPGYAATNLPFVAPKETGDRLTGLAMRVGNVFLAQSAAAGALPTLYAATAPDVNGGDFIGPRWLRGVWGAPVKQRSSRASRDEAAAARLWDESIRRTGVAYDGP